jgi:hypothetical protein
MDLRFRLVLPNRPMGSDITEQQFLRALNDHSPRFGTDQLSSLPGYDVERKRFRLLLGGYVDKWIDTGVTQDGREFLRERGISRAEWFEKGRLLPYAFKKKMGLVDVLTVVLGVFQQKPSATFVSPAEGLEITFSAYEPKFSGTSLNGLAEREAKRFFVWFLASDLRMKLGKCRACEIYKIKTRPFYKSGTYCRRCKARTSALEITRKKRQDIQRKREEALNAVLKSWKGTIDWNDLRTRKRLTDDMNRRLKNEEKITSKWIKRDPSKHRQHQP